MTVLFVTHDLSVARLMGDRIAVMQSRRDRRDRHRRPGHRQPAARVHPDAARLRPRDPGGPGLMSTAVVPRTRIRPIPGVRLARPLSIAARRPARDRDPGRALRAGARALRPGPAGRRTQPARRFSPDHLLGTDSIGRDLLSRTLVGMQISWFSALAVVASGLVIGGIVGVVAGVPRRLARRPAHARHRPVPRPAGRPRRHRDRRGARDRACGTRSIAIAIVWWPYYARIIRGEVKALAARPHVEAARLAGVGRGPARLPAPAARRRADRDRHGQPRHRQRDPAAGRAVVPRPRPAGTRTRARRRHRPQPAAAAEPVVGAGRARASRCCS